MTPVTVAAHPWATTDDTPTRHLHHYLFIHYLLTCYLLTQ